MLPEWDILQYSVADIPQHSHCSSLDIHALALQSKKNYAGMEENALVLSQIKSGNRISQVKAKSQKLLSPC